MQPDSRRSCGNCAGSGAKCPHVWLSGLGLFGRGLPAGLAAAVETTGPLPALTQRGVTSCAMRPGLATRSEETAGGGRPGLGLPRMGLALPAGGILATLAPPLPATLPPVKPPAPLLAVLPARPPPKPLSGRGLVHRGLAVAAAILTLPRPDSTGIATEPAPRGPDSTGLAAAPAPRGPDSAALATTLAPRGPDSTGLAAMPAPRGPDNTGLAATPALRGPDSIGLATTPEPRGVPSAWGACKFCAGGVDCGVPCGVACCGEACGVTCGDASSVAHGVTCGDAFGVAGAARMERGIGELALEPAKSTAGAVPRLLGW